jgi:hypothetical protein
MFRKQSKCFGSYIIVSNRRIDMTQAERNAASKRNYYYRNQQAQIDRVDKRRRETRQWLNEMKTKLKCEQCGENHPATLHFHHTDSTQKEKSVSNAAAQGWSITRIEKEIAKCVVLCANCHAKEHYASLV